MPTRLDLIDDALIGVAGDWHGQSRDAVERVEFAAARGAALLVHISDIDFGLARHRGRYLSARVHPDGPAVE